jgi:hypothetical protein
LNIQLAVEGIRNFVKLAKLAFAQVLNNFFKLARLSFAKPAHKLQIHILKSTQIQFSGGEPTLGIPEAMSFGSILGDQPDESGKFPTGPVPFRTIVMLVTHFRNIQLLKCSERCLM